jgi:DNA-binding NtrC family response regulator
MEEHGVTKKSSFVPGRGTRRLRVVVADGPAKGTIVESEGAVLSVGSAKDNGLVLADPTVSRYHIELRQAPTGVEVKDLGSLNGTYVGDLKFNDGLVPPGTRLRLGDSTIEVSDGALELPHEESVPEIAGIVAQSRPMLEVLRTVEKIAKTDVSVLVQGETGTGKEVICETIHRLGTRASGPFVVVDCGSMPATLVASELFGHERGAYTGAERRRAGAFERAHRGTLFLDEIGELPLDVQPMLLGALERRRFLRVGGQQEVEVDCRVVAATHRDLRAAVNAGTFRADLYFRLAVARIVLPPLRERPEDIALLVRHFVQQITGNENLAVFGHAAMQTLASHHWAGNVRELRNVVESAIAMGRLQIDALQNESAAGAEAAAEVVPYKRARADAIDQFERSYLSTLVDSCGGNVSEAARQAKMDRAYLWTLLRKHGLR